MYIYVGMWRSRCNFNDPSRGDQQLKLIHPALESKIELCSLTAVTWIRCCWIISISFHISCLHFVLVSILHDMPWIRFDLIFSFFYFLEETNSPALLSILTSESSGDACLAAGFAPKKGTLYVTGDQNTVNHTVDRAVLSTQKTYYFAAFSENRIKTCKMNNIIVNKTDEKCKYHNLLIFFPLR